MQYMLLIYDQEKNYANRTDAERAAFTQEYREFTQSIVMSGHLRAGSQLQPVKTAATVRASGEKRTVTDGPFAETKEQLGGYYLIEAKDREEALAIAGRIPSVRAGGSVEVRALVPMM